MSRKESYKKLRIWLIYENVPPFNFRKCPVYAEKTYLHWVNPLVCFCTQMHLFSIVLGIWATLGFQRIRGSMSIRKLE